MTRIRFLLGSAILSALILVGVTQLPQTNSQAARCSIYSGIVMNATNQAVQLWHGPFCSVTVVHASRGSTCQPGEYFNGYTCPDNGGGGGDSW